ncbi:MAG: YdcF family protein [Steroidobacteraceae bacterium]
MPARAAGGIMHMLWVLFKQTARSLILPPTGLLVLAVVGAALLASRHRRSGWACLLTGLALLWLLSTPMVALELSLLVESYPAFDPAKPTSAQAIVILGGAGDRSRAPEYGGQPAVELDLLERLNYGAWLARTTHLPILVTSNGANVYAMSVSLARDFQVPARWVDWKSLDTFDNARYSAELLRASHVDSIVLVTSSTHMLRATREFLATGLKVTPAPVHMADTRDFTVFSFLPSSEAMVYSNRAVYELLGEPVRELLAALHVRRQRPG